jgi:hypothetical protein
MFVKLPTQYFKLHALPVFAVLSLFTTHLSPPLTILLALEKVLGTDLMMRKVSKSALTDTYLVLENVVLPNSISFL